MSLSDQVSVLLFPGSLDRKRLCPFLTLPSAVTVSVSFTSGQQNGMFALLHVVSFRANKIPSNFLNEC